VDRKRVLMIALNHLKNARCLELRAIENKF